MSSITIRKLSITDLQADAVVNAANSALMMAGIYGYPQEQAWERAITACRDFISDNPDYEIEIIFCVLEDSILEMGQKILG